MIQTAPNITLQLQRATAHRKAFTPQDASAVSCALAVLGGFITEKDFDPDGAGQIQAFGLADLGDGGEVGYINLVELIENGIELDWHWTPKTLAEVQVGRR